MEAKNQKENEVAYLEQLELFLAKTRLVLRRSDRRKERLELERREIESERQKLDVIRCELRRGKDEIQREYGRKHLLQRRAKLETHNRSLLGLEGSDKNEVYQDLADTYQRKLRYEWSVKENEENLERIAGLETKLREKEAERDDNQLLFEMEAERKKDGFVSWRNEKLQKS
uniref:Uncharacterized protein n=1 Tax=Caenorhabditis japonica TaxID=281687 RepID=A0A8R1IL03_CAEJA